MIEKKLINFKKEADYKLLKEAGNIKETSIVFIDDAKKIVTHNTEFDCSGGSGIPVPKANQFVYTSIDNNKLELTADSSYTNIVETIVSNELINGYGVITFKENITKFPAMYSVFASIEKLVSIILPDSITSFERSGFSGCSNLKGINVPTGITELPYMCFYKCASLESLYLPSSVTTIGSYCFQDSGIRNINLDYVSEIQYSAFQDASKFDSLCYTYSGKGDLTIGNNAFNNCGNLRSINILAKYSNTGIIVGEYAFLLSGIRSLSVSSQHNNFKSVGGYCFNRCEDLTTVSIDVWKSIQLTGREAFANCKSLTTVYLSSYVTSIGDYCFSNCNNIEKLIIRYTGELGGSIGNVGKFCNIDYSPSNIKYFAAEGNCLGDVILNSTTLVQNLNNTLYPNNVSRIFVPNTLLNEYKSTYPTLAKYFHSLTGEDPNNYWTGTQEEYDAIDNKDSSIFYFIKEEE